MAGFGKIAFTPTGSIDLTLRGRDAFSIGPQGQLIPRQPEAGMRRITPASGITASTAPTPGFGDVIARQAAARLEAANRMRAAQAGRAAPAAPTIGQRLGTAFRQPLTSPTGMGIMSAALTGLEQAGPQPVPTSTGQILARMGAAGLQAYSQAEKARQAREAAEAKARQDEEYRQQMLQLKRGEIEASRAAAGMKSGRDLVKLERDLRKDYEASAEPFVNTKQFFSDVVNFSGEDNTAAEDLALVFSYMKLLDPGSVVREGEQYQVRSLGNIPDSFKVILSQYGFIQDDSGEMQKMLLPNTVREDIRAAASEKYADLITRQYDLEKEYVAIGERADLSKDYFSPKLKQTGTIRDPIYATTEAEAKAVPQGSYVVFNGKMYRKP